MTEAPATQCPRCQSTKLKSVRFGDQMGTVAFWVLAIGFYLTLFELLTIITYLLEMVIVALIVITSALKCRDIRHWSARVRACLREMPAT